MDFKSLNAYELILQEQIPDINSEGFLLRHKKSGARIMLLKNEDENKVFNIAFRTTPSDNTGVAHIMEHTVLCGSRKFPAKDPFVELVKGSMNTFLNAMTYPDKTMFPVASCNDRDFANLMDVYLDAVLFPNIYRKEEIFRQEGWHYQLEKKEDPIVYNGVVYNEMKGAFSTPDDVVEREIMNSLFPDTTYGFESGGDPDYIPDLTYEAYLDFHRRFYHPSNSYIYLYGDMDFEERLDWLDREYLSLFEKIEVDSAVELQKPFDRMRILKKEYPISAEGDDKHQTFLAYSTVVGTSMDTRLASACAVLEYVLLESPGAPLKQALLDEGIGRDILSSYDSGICQPVFSIIAKEADPDQQERFLEVIRSTLTNLADEGLDEKAVRAAINIMEFRFREADYGSYPKGLMYGLDIFDSWLYDDEKPFDYLRQLDDYEFLKQQIGTGYYEELIRTYLLDNPHSTLLMAVPRRGLTALSEQAVREKLDALKASLSDEQLDEMVEKTRKLRAFQETPSTKEELEAIPLLTREDLKKTAEPFQNEILQAEGAWILYHDYQTNGIAYLNLYFDASGISPEDLPYLGLMKHILGYVNTDNHTYSELSNEVNLNTGGISYGVSLFPDAADKDILRLALGVQVRTLYDRIDFCFDMIREVLFSSDLTSDKRLLEIIRKVKSRTGTRLSEAGSATAATRCMSYFSSMHRINDNLIGVEFYETLKDLETNFEEKKEDFKKALRRIMDRVLTGDMFLVSYTGDRAQLEKIRDGIEKIRNKMPGVKTAKQDEAANVQQDPAAAGGQVLDVLGIYPSFKPEQKNEGFRTPGKVQYVARAGNFADAGLPYTGALRVLRTIMNFEYLWSNIRVVGGAYGCSASFLRSGDVTFVSYRDPQLGRTMQVFEEVPEFVESFTVDERDMTKYVIGTISDMDTPLGANAKGNRSTSALLGSLTLERVQAERDQVLGVTQEDIRALAPLCRAALDQNNLCVLGNEDRIEESKDLFLITRDL